MPTSRASAAGEVKNTLVPCRERLSNYVPRDLYRVFTPSLRLRSSRYELGRHRFNGTRSSTPQADRSTAPSAESHLFDKRTSAVSHDRRFVGPEIWSRVEPCYCIGGSWGREPPLEYSTVPGNIPGTARLVLP